MVCGDDDVSMSEESRVESRELYYDRVRQKRLSRSNTDNMIKTANNKRSQQTKTMPMLIDIISQAAIIILNNNTMMTKPSVR